MASPRAPALVPALGLALGIWLARAQPVPPPVAALAPLLALAVAIGGVAGRALAATALGALLAVTAPPRLEPEVGALVEAIGTAGTARRTGTAGWALPVRVERMRTGRTWSHGRVEVLADLPPGLAPPTAGTRVRIRGTLGRAPGLANRHPVGPGPWHLRIKAPPFLEALARPGALARLRARLRGRVLGLFGEAERRGRSGPGLQVLRALALGDAAALPPGWRRALRRAGLGHLVAVSGLHVSIVALLAAAAASAAGRRLRLLAIACAVLGYLALVAPAHSVARAAASALLVVVALACDRAPEARQAFAVVLAGMLASAPDRLFELGFQLSFAATGGLLWLAPRWTRRVGDRLPRPLALALSATLAAQAASLPFSVAAFAEVAPAAPLFNLLAAPWAALVLAVAGIWIPIGLFAPAAALAAAPGLDPLALPLQLLERLPPSAWVSSSWPGGWTAGFALSGLIVAWAEGGAWRRGGVVTFLLLPLCGAARATSGPVELGMLDVGQGDATVLRHGETVFLIDGGGGPRGVSAGLRAVRPALALSGVVRIEVMILTHPDADHCAGLVDLVHEVPVGEIWLPEGAEDDPCPRALRGATDRPLRALAAGDRIDRSGVRVEVLHPRRRTPADSDNAASLVARIEVAGRSLLITGDIGRAEERELVLSSRAALRVDFLRVPHHGSDGSSSRPFLIASRPALALLSSGARNAYGHPSPAALERYRSGGIRVLRTDRDGEVVLRWSAGQPVRLSLPGSPPRRR